MAQRRGFFPRSRSKPRLTDWALGPGSSVTTNFSSSTSSILGSGVTPTTDKLTIVRTRGELTAFLNTASALDNGFACAVGIGIVTNAAFAIGATAVPDPIDDAEWDGWLYHRFFNLISPTAISNTAITDADSVGIVSNVVRFEVDSKAMRKQDLEETLMAVVQAVEVGTATMSVQFNSRTLVMLS